MDALREHRRVSLEIALELLSRVREGASARGLSLACAVVDDGVD
jgi:predicted DNA binding CopG/RHH family protein